MKIENLIKASTEILDSLAKQWNCSASVKNQIQTLRIDLKFLSTFFMFADLMVPWAQFKKAEAEAAVQDVGEGIADLYLEVLFKVPVELDHSLSAMLNDIELIKPQVHQMYHRISRVWPLRLEYGGDFQVRFVECVLENLKDLLQSEVHSIAGVEKLVMFHERRLIFLRNFLQSVAELRKEDSRVKDLHHKVGCVASASASFTFSCWMRRYENNEPFLKRDTKSLYLVILEASRLLAPDAVDARLASLIDFLLELLAGLLAHRDGSLEIPVKGDHFERLPEDLKLVKSLLTMPQTDFEKSYRQYIAAPLDAVARIVEDFYVGNVMPMDLQCFGRLKLITLFWVVDRANEESSWAALMKDQLETLREDIRLLRTFFCDTQKGPVVERKFWDIYSLMDTMALNAGSALCTFYLNIIKEDIAEEMSYRLPDLLDKIKHIKAGMRKFYPHATSSNFNSAQTDMIDILKELNELLNSWPDTISRCVNPRMRKVAKLWIETLQNELEFLVSFLENYLAEMKRVSFLETSKEQSNGIGEVKALEICIMNMANNAKYVTEPRFLNYYPVWYCMLKFSDVMEEVKLIKEETRRISEKFCGEMLPSQDVSSPMGEVIVGFEDEARYLIEQLIEESKQLKVISIVGMAGLGKTTLARKLYNHPSTVHYFHVQAWCCISQVFDERQVLLDILGQVDELTEEMYQKKTDTDLKDKLRKCLKGRRYLIVLDDIWDIKAWTAIRRCFDDDLNGSRIMFTTRLQQVASEVQQRQISRLLRPFSDDESKELLQKKLFPGKVCARKQLEILKEIAKHCKGLPLAVVLMAGILAKKKEEEWEQVVKSLSQHTNGDLQNLSREVLDLSYTNLPDHLRPCFLYLGAFPEDKEILAKKLMWLWVAEGFIQKTEEKSSEEIAKDYLMDLIHRSLIKVTARGSSGWVKRFCIHDLLRSFSLTKAKEENFLLLLNQNDEPFVPPNLKFQQHVNGRYRLCIYSKLKKLKKWTSSLNVCSLLNFAPPSKPYKRLSYDASFIFSSFKFLNTLNLEGFLLKDLSRDIQLLVQLRFLAVWIQSNSIPSSIASLKNLETFLVKGTRGEVAIPNSIWSMVNLRHFHVDKRASSMLDKIDVKDAILDKLETLSTPTLPCETNSRDVIRSLPKLRKLKCIVTASWSQNCYRFPELGSLSQLESLKMFYYAEKVSHGRFRFPQNLKKLTLSKFRLPWSDIAEIGRKLPNLEVLKLLSRAFEGKQWKTSEGEFPKLKYLKLETLDIAQWDVTSEDHFPVLEKLLVHRCKQLEGIPSSFGDINTLQMIEVKWCNLSAASSAKLIYQEQEEFGNEELKVNIHPHPSDQDFTSSS